MVPSRVFLFCSKGLRALILSSGIAASAAVLVGCDAGSVTTPSPGAGSGTAPWLTLPAGSRYFEKEGRRAPVLLRNISAPDVPTFTTFLGQAHAAGTTVVRVQLTQGFGYDTLGIDANGAVLPDFASSWDSVLDEAERQELSVVVVFAIWGDWNDGTPDLGWTHFSANPLGSALGGPAQSPADLFVPGSATQTAWIGWATSLVDRWKARPNIVAWEVFSELDIASGSTEATATAFAEAAADAVRAKDPMNRPVLASTTDGPLLQGAPWTQLWASRANDLVSVHVYDENLDTVATSRVQTVLSLTQKPILIGESGLDAATPDGTNVTSAPNAAVGLRHAIWAELLSGAVDARALYWEDGYAVNVSSSEVDLVDADQDLEATAAQWLGDTDFSTLAPLGVMASPQVYGAALGSETLVLGWVRNGASLPPDWTAAAESQVSVWVVLPSGAADGMWTVTLTDPTSGVKTNVVGTSVGGRLTFTIASLADAVGFEAHP